MNSFFIKDLKIKLPIVQGGMGVGISGASLAAAVAKQGGIGVISAAGLWLLNSKYNAKDFQVDCIALKDEIVRARKETSGVLGVNIMVALKNFENLVYTSITSGIDIIFAGAGLPLKLPEILAKAKSEQHVDKNQNPIKTKLVPIISSAKAINVLTKHWISKYNYPPDAFVLEGPMAGGHLGFKEEDIYKEEFSLENLVISCCETLKELEEKYSCKIPLVAGGGLFTGKDIKNILDKGASAVQIGTRFVATEECDADIAFKEAYVNCKKEDITIIKSPVGLPGRAINNDFLKKAKLGLKKPKSCPFHCLSTCKEKESPYCISVALANACKGNLGNGFVFCGENAHMVDKIVPVEDLIKTLKEEYNS